mmetsp:Transcript_63003/g.150070  ORF Transcript_63003/g.150070 Transcript_63003/m.150070 type:complete len:287 (+) Transcript_63003:453-1313(+)
MLDFLFVLSIKLVRSGVVLEVVTKELVQSASLCRLSNLVQETLHGRACWSKRLDSNRRAGIPSGERCWRRSRELWLEVLVAVLIGGLAHVVVVGELVAVVLKDHRGAAQDHEALGNEPVLLGEAKLGVHAKIVWQRLWSSAEGTLGSTNFPRDGCAWLPALGSRVLRMALVDKRLSQAHAQGIDHLLGDILLGLILVGSEGEVIHLVNIQAADATFKQARLPTASITINLPMLVVGAAHGSPVGENEHVHQAWPVHEHVEEDGWVEVAHAMSHLAVGCRTGVVVAG